MMKWFVLLFAHNLFAEPITGARVISKPNDLVDKIYEKCREHAPGPREIKDDGKVREFNDCVGKELDERPEQAAQFREQFWRGVERASVQRSRSRGTELLFQYMSDRFEEKVRKGSGGEDGAKRVVDHIFYFEFYQSQLSKIVTIAIKLLLHVCRYRKVARRMAKYKWYNQIL